MATWWTLTFEGEPTEDDFQRVSEMTAQGFTSGQLVNEEEDEGETCGRCGKPIAWSEASGLWWAPGDMQVTDTPACEHKPA